MARPELSTPSQFFPGDLAQLRSFYYAAVYRSFTRAAEQLLTTQPSISTHIKSLEQLMGRPLFLRHARGATLTEAGEALFDLVEPLVEGIDQLQGSLSDRLGSDVQEVRLAAGHELLLHLAGPALQVYRERHPDVRLVVYSSTRGQTEDMVAADEIDFGITSGPITSPYLTFEPVLNDELILICPLDHPLAQRSIVSIADVAPYPMLMAAPESSARAAIEAAIARTGRELRVAMELERWHMIKEFVALGQGIALVPSFTVAGEGDRLALRPVRGGLPPLLYGILTRRGRHLPAPVRNLIEAISEKGGSLEVRGSGPLKHP